MNYKFLFALTVSTSLLTGCEDAATRQSRKNRGAGQPASAASSSSSEGFSASVENNRNQHVQGNQEFMDALSEFARTMGSIHDIPSANQSLQKAGPLLDKVDAIVTKVAGYPKLKSDEKTGLANTEQKAEVEDQLKRALGGARGHLVLSDKQETFEEIVARFKEICKKADKVMLQETVVRF